MSITETTTAPSGPPPVATTHDHHGVIVTSIERPEAELVASSRAPEEDSNPRHADCDPARAPLCSAARTAIRMLAP